MYLIVFKLIGYRKSVVYDNLKNSFPDITDEDIIAIQKKFFKHLCDVIMESIKLFSISESDLRERFKITNPEIFRKLYDQGRSIILVGGHYNNWEFPAMGLNLLSPYQAIGIYTPLRNKFFDEKFKVSRTKYGVEVIRKSDTPRSFIRNRHNLTMTIFGADQSPTYTKRVHWMNFLNQETAVFLGVESFSVKYNNPVVFIRIDKTKRGHYEGTLEVLSENPAATSPGQITELHTKYLEKIIREKPQHWLWSHKRWKRNKTEEEKVAEMKNVQQAS